MPAKKTTQVSEEAVVKATGRTWEQWFSLLDKAGATKLKHGEIARLLQEKHGVSAWWSQSVTVAYERARGVREKHEAAGGFQISASKTLAVPVGRLFEAWNDPIQRRKWLGEKVTIRKATLDKSLRITWEADGTNLEVYLTAKAADKSQVAIQHSKLADQEQAAAKKAYWTERLAALKTLLEG